LLKSSNAYWSASIAGLENLDRHLDYMASQVPREATAQELEAALDDALAHVRPPRSWQP
jgi:hypothetical protein